MTRVASNRMLVPFYCPACGNECDAELVADLIYADHEEPSLRCTVCATEWCVSLHEPEDEREAVRA